MNDSVLLIKKENDLLLNSCDKWLTLCKWKKDTMVFSSLLFIYLFLPICIILYYSVKNRKFKNFILLISSLCFYAWGEPVWFVVLLISGCIDYYHGLYIGRFHGTKWAKYGIVSSIILNLSLLIAFKYSAFVYENINLIF